MYKPHEYKGYSIAQEGANFVGRPTDPDEFPIEIVGKSVPRVMIRIDELWLILDNPAMMRPAWVEEWLSGTKIRVTPDTDAIVSSLLDTFDLNVGESDLDMATYTVDQFGRIDYFNTAAAQLWGRCPTLFQEFWTGAHQVLDPVSLEEIPKTESWMARSIRTGMPLRDRRVLIVRPDGTRIEALSHPTPLRGEHGTIIGGINHFTPTDPTLRSTLLKAMDPRDMCGAGGGHLRGFH